MRAKKSFKIRPLLWRWHRRLGLVVALLLLLLAVTGIQLNHLEALRWDQKPVHSRWLLEWYGVERPALTSFQAGPLWLSDITDGRLYVNAKPLSSCAGGLVGVADAAPLVLVACQHELVLLTREGQLLERIAGGHQLPQPIERLGQCAEAALCLRANNQWYLIDLQNLRWTPTELSPTQYRSPSRPPAKIRRQLLQKHSGGITWERVLQDLHSGRLFGLGPWLMDLVGVLLIGLSVSGVWLWASGVQRRRNRR